jgi:hypothetical protein
LNSAPAAARNWNLKGHTLKVKINNMKFAAQVVQTWAVHIVWVRDVRNAYIILRDKTSGRQSL